MARSSSAAYDQGGDDFDVASQLAILRRAVAGIVLPGKHLPSELAVGQSARSAAAANATARTELRRFCSLAQVVVGQSRTLSELGARLARGLPNRALLGRVRGELYDCLVRASALVPGEPVPAAPGIALSMRALLSDFCSALLPRTDDADFWPLTVAAAELSLLLLQPAVKQGPERERQRLFALAARTGRWRERGSGVAEAAELYLDVASTFELLDSLNQRPDVRRHDERVLRELARLLSRPTHDLVLAGAAADRLSVLRGRDRELDRLIVALPLEPVLTLDGIARRVRKLCLPSPAS